MNEGQEAAKMSKPFKIWITDPENVHENILPKDFGFFDGPKDLPLYILIRQSRREEFLICLGLILSGHIFLFHPHSTTLNPLHFPQQKRLKISISKEIPPLLPPANSQLWWGTRGGTSMAPEKVLGEWHYRGGGLLFCIMFRYGFYWFKFHWMTSV
jgi:hypothetical protein